MTRAAVYAGADGAARVARAQRDELVDAGPAPPGGFVPTEAAWAALEAADGRRLDATDVRLLTPVRPSKLVCVGLNYRDHAAEAGQPLPARPLLFAKLPSAVIGPDEPVLVFDEADEMDYEAELALVVSRRIGPRDPVEPLAAIGGYTALNDVSARAVQMSEGQWTRGKSFDASAPLGPAIVRADPGFAWGELPVRCRVSGELLQDGHTRDLVFSPGELVAFIAARITLEPGDVIATGTPAGVGMAREPQRFLRAGDTLETIVGAAGVLRNPVRAARSGG
jgi:2-keto-4-pentenoate hydratase/2-oxohepta-3-ene-1,7-dioic acid hydratase in catechol pathway